MRPNRLTEVFFTPNATLRPPLKGMAFFFGIAALRGCIFPHAFLSKSRSCHTDAASLGMTDLSPRQVRATINTHFRNIAGRDQLYDKLAEGLPTPIRCRTVDAAFRKAFGLTPFQYLRLRRLQEAQHLLSTTQGSVAEVARAIGLPGRRGLYRLFKRYLGVTPGEFRSRLAR